MLHQTLQYGYSINVSADGTAFGTIPTGYGPVSYEAVMIVDDSILTEKFGGTSNAFRYARPSANGRLFFLPGGKVFNAVLKDMSPAWLDGSETFPTVDPRYFIAVRFVSQSRDKFITRVDICTASDLRIVHGMTDLHELAPDGNSNSIHHRSRQLSSGQTKIHYVPWANLIANTSYDSKRVHVRKYDFLGRLGESGEDYLFVESLPPLIAFKGKQLSYQIQCKTNSENIEFNLSEGPDGLRVSESGLVTWTPSKGMPEGFVSVVINVKGGTGDETFHTFDLLVIPKRTTRRR